jgi:bifunctional non-homologous end joining protein LigD
VKALAAMPDETVIDGEVVALDGDGKPSFNALQNSASRADLHYFIFDLLILKGQDVMGEPSRNDANYWRGTSFPR